MNRKPNRFHNLLAFYPYRSLIREWVFLFLFIGLSSSNLFAQFIPATKPPSYTWKDYKNLPTVYLNTDDLTIAIATDPDGNVYTLTFGSGVDKRSSDGTLIKKGFIPANKLENPLDIAVDENGLIYIADFLAGDDGSNGKIKVFDQQRKYLSNIHIYTSYFRPLGIDVDSNFVYVAEYNDGKQGPESSPSSRFSIYNKTDGTPVKETDDIEIPFRVAVDSKKNIYVSQAGNNDPAVLIFDNNLNLKGQLPNIQSPGSVVVDDFDFIHVLEYAGRIDFSRFINFNDLGPNDILAISKQIHEGTKNQEFVVKIYSPNGSYKSSFVDHVDFPIDLAFGTCDKLYLDNADISAITFPVFFPTSMNFDLEIYQRSPSFDSFSGPVISCPEDISVTTEEGKDYAVVNFSKATATDNCDATVEQTKGNPSESQFPIGSTEIEFTATDAFGNTDVCSFQIIVKANDQVSDVNCKPTILYLDSQGKATLDPKAIFDGEANDAAIDKLEVDKENFSCADINAENEVKLTVFYKNGTSGSCTTNIQVKDTIAPKFACNIKDIEVELKDGETYTVPNFTTQLTATDNCDNNPVISQDLAKGTEISESRTVILTAKDASDNVSNACSVNIIITKKPKPTFDCPDPDQETILEKDENCDFKVPDYSGKLTNFQHFEKDPDFVQTESRNGNILTVTITVFDGKNGDNVGECTFPVSLEDNTPPTLTCPPDILVPYTTSKTYTLKDYFSDLDVNDNCSQTFTHTQTPQPGKIITDDTVVEFSVTDENGNENTCNFNIKFYKETELQILNCPGPQTIEVDSNCSYLTPDVASTIKTNIEGAVVTQNINEGVLINDPQTLIITATFENQTDTCEVNLIPKDTMPPVVSCPPTQNETVQPEEGFELPNYTLNATTTDPCGIASFEQQPQPGTTIYKTTEITLTAKDVAGNPASCSFTVNITETGAANQIPVFDNCQTGIAKSNDIGLCGAKVTFATPTATDSNGGNAAVTQTKGPISGDIFPVGATRVTFTATDTQGSSSQCSFEVTVTDAEKPVKVTCPPDQSGTLTNGEFTLLDYRNLAKFEDNCDNDLILTQIPSQGTEISESKTITITATDNAGNISEPCTFQVIIKAEDPNQPQPDFSCKDEITVELDENGEAKITPTDIYIGNGEGYTFNIDKNTFTCDDIGENAVILYFNGTNTRGQCDVTVVVKDNLPPKALAKDITVALNQNQQAIITASMLDNGSFDNCSDVQLSVDKSTFGCKNIGENVIILTATDAQGNTSTTSAVVTVTGECKNDSLDEKYIFIYPNPTQGSFNFYVPPGFTLSRAEVYDMRGRNILNKDFAEDTQHYSMDITGLEEAVYTLKLFTNKGVKIVRVIKK